MWPGPRGPGHTRAPPNRTSVGQCPNPNRASLWRAYTPRGMLFTSHDPGRNPMTTRPPDAPAPQALPAPQTLPAPQALPAPLTLHDQVAALPRLDAVAPQPQVSGLGYWARVASGRHAAAAAVAVPLLFWAYAVAVGPEQE